MVCLMVSGSSLRCSSLMVPRCSASISERMAVGWLRRIWKSDGVCDGSMTSSPVVMRCILGRRVTWTCVAPLLAAVASSLAARVVPVAMSMSPDLQSEPMGWMCWLSSASIPSCGRA